MALQGVDETLKTILGCVDDALKEAGAPTCTVGTTIGNPAIANCCECAAGTSGELWGSLRRIYQGDLNTGAEVRTRKPCAATTWYAQYQVTLARCFPTINDRGDLPDPMDLSAAASALHADTATIQRAIHCCTATDEPPYLEQVAVTTDPSGGCSILTATLRVRVSMGHARNQRA